ncbi:MAG TPA: hypothetical protein V6D22_12095 [Candidatus Obscuribacterales bacterium]
MGESSTAEKATIAAHKTKVEKAQSYLTVASTTIGIIGAVGAGFAWAATTFFLGDVQIRPDKPVDSLCVKITDKRGQTAFYYGKDVQLMPGKYHLQIGLADKELTQHADVDVRLWKIAVIPFSVPAAGAAAMAADATNTDIVPQHKRWWQFWRKGTASDGQSQ